MKMMILMMILYDDNDETADRETKLGSAVYRKIGTMICITPLNDA